MDNILLITIDSLRADHVGCFGYDRETTPTINSLANSGNRFSNAFSHSGTTRTSFPAILTSSHALMYGGYARISDNRTLVSEVLKDAGYQTAGFHSNLYLSADFGYNRGFDTFFDSKSSPSVTARLRQLVKQKLDSDSHLFRFLRWAFEASEKHAGIEVGSAYVPADDLTEMAKTWIHQTNPDRPVFLWTHYMDVHHPYLPPEEHQVVFRDRPISDRRSIQLRRKMLENSDEITHSELQTLIDLYDAEIRYVDTQIGRLVDFAREKLDGQTVVIITADHGEEFADHGRFSHNTVHDECIHVPLIVNDRKSQGTYDNLVGLLDISPTIVECSGQHPPDSFHGHSVYRLIEGDEWERRSVIGNWKGENPEGRRFFYRDFDWKFIQWPDGTEELYDLQQDPRELNNIVDDSPDVVNGLREEIQTHEKEVDATYEEIEQVEMDEVTKERLELLGYTE